MSDSAELRRERNGEKRRGKRSRSRSKRDARICYSEGGVRREAFERPKRRHSQVQRRKPGTDGDVRAAPARRLSDLPNDLRKEE